MELTDKDIAVDLDKCSQPMDLQDLFPNPGPVEIEIGSGKGTFLVHQAKANLNINYLGIEWASRYYRHSCDRLARWKLSNTRMLRADARDFIRDYVKDSSIEALHIYYPDPWPKKRHNKRRFFAQDNMLEVIRCLKTGGQLRVATDHEEYFQQMQEVLLKDQKIASCFQKIDFCPAEGAKDGELVGTNFERKYIREGRNSYKIALSKL
ncbi:MAG: tRNA (guanosine(46)-N7)-methyltransferase TrmB [Phycisphaerae bacterium]|nr:tRNA (guanosine(46)-N7)-methyltransferase TrmB [Phycisphaerae bacterium]